MLGRAPRLPRLLGPHLRRDRLLGGVLLLFDIVDELLLILHQCEVVGNFDTIVEAHPSIEVIFRHSRRRWHLNFRIRGREGECLTLLDKTALHPVVADRFSGDLRPRFLQYVHRIQEMDGLGHILHISVFVFIDGLHNRVAESVAEVGFQGSNYHVRLEDGRRGGRQKLDLDVLHFVDRNVGRAVVDKKQHFAAIFDELAIQIAKPL